MEEKKEVRLNRVCGRGQGKRGGEEGRRRGGKKSFGMREAPGRFELELHVDQVVDLLCRETCANFAI